VESMAGLWNPQEEAGVKGVLGLQLLGDAAAIEDQLSQLLETVEQLQ